MARAIYAKRDGFTQALLAISCKEVTVLIKSGVLATPQEMRKVKVTKRNYGKVLNAICVHMNCSRYQIPITFRSPAKLSKLLFKSFLYNEGFYADLKASQFIAEGLCDDPKDKKAPKQRLLFKDLRKRLQDLDILIHDKSDTNYPKSTRYLPGGLLKKHLNNQLKLDELQANGLFVSSQTEDEKPEEEIPSELAKLDKKSLIMELKRKDTLIEDTKQQMADLQATWKQTEATFKGVETNLMNKLDFMMKTIQEAIEKPSKEEIKSHLKLVYSKQ